MIDLDIPSPETVLQKLFDGHIQIGGEQECRLAIKQLATLGQTVSYRSNDHDGYGKIRPRFSPERHRSFEHRPVIIEMSVLPYATSLLGPKPLHAQPEGVWSEKRPPR